MKTKIIEFKKELIRINRKQTSYQSQTLSIKLKNNNQLNDYGFCH